MRVMDYVKLMNKDKLIKVDRVCQLKKYYLSMYKAYMMKLYDIGYIKDPTKWDVVQIRKNIVDLGIDGLFNTCGEVKLDLDYIQFAICKHRKSEVISEFLQLLYNVVKYKSYAFDVDNVYEEFNFAKGDRQKLNPYLRMSNCKIECGLGSGLTRAVLECMIPENETVHVLYVTKYLWESGCMELDIPREDWNCDGLFVEGMSHRDELLNIPLIFNGDVNVSGRYSDNLNDWLFNHKWKIGTAINADCKGLYDYLFYANMSGAFDDLSEKLNFLASEGKNLIGVVGNCIYYSEPIKYYNVPMGCFMVLSGDDDDLMPDSISLNGLTGEFYTTEFVVEEGIKYVGCPVECFYVDSDTGNIDSEFIFDFEQLDMKCDSYFVNEHLEYEFEGNLVYTGKEFQDELTSQIYKIYVDSLNGELIGTVDASKYSLSEIKEAKKKIMRKLV